MNNFNNINTKMKKGCRLNNVQRFEMKPQHVVVTENVQKTGPRESLTNGYRNGDDPCRSYTLIDR
jgi:hypothetical protein